MRYTHCFSFFITFNKQVVALLLLFMCNTRSVCSDNNSDGLDYTKYISNHLLKGEYYLGASYDVMPKDMSLLGLLKTHNININKKERRLHIKHCKMLISNQESVNEKNILLNCLNYLIDKHSITHITFNFVVPMITYSSDIKKNKAHIPLVLFSKGLIWFFQRLNGIEYIGFYGEEDDSKEHLFIEEPIYNTIQAIEKEKIPNTLKSSKTDYILLMQIQPQKKIYFINVILKCLLTNASSDNAQKSQKKDHQIDTAIEQKPITPTVDSGSKESTPNQTKKFYSEKSFIYGSIFVLCLLCCYAYIHYV